ncbi:hypothetical protein [Acidisoma sp.]|uniref:hypothetical protein n=1 Tax=Acidisoma sp. TaxID=1872115 RepID=UPI003B00D81C
MPAKPRGQVTTAYVVVGVVAWPVVTALIYWADRLATGLSGLGPTGASIGFWAASGCALIVSALIVIAGWLQSSHRF